MIKITTTIQNTANSIVTAYDIKGSEMFTKSIVSDNETIDLSSLTIGVYYTKAKK